MKEATGELNMTVVTIVLIGIITAFFTVFWPTIQNSIQNQWKKAETGNNKVDGLIPSGQ